MREYDFICKNGVYAICLKGHSKVGVLGIGSADRVKALRQAREYCNSNIAKLNIKA